MQFTYCIAVNQLKFRSSAFMDVWIWTARSTILRMKWLQLRIPVWMLNLILKFNSLHFGELNVHWWFICCFSCWLITVKSDLFHKFVWLYLLCVLEHISFKIYWLLICHCRCLLMICTIWHNDNNVIHKSNYITKSSSMGHLLWPTV